MNSKRVKDSIKRVTEKLLQLSNEKLIQKLKEQNNSNIVKILRDTKALEVGEIEVDSFSNNSLLNYVSDNFNTDVFNYLSFFNSVNDCIDIVSKKVEDSMNTISSTLNNITQTYMSSIEYYIKNVNYIVESMEIPIISYTQKKDYEHNVYRMEIEEEYPWAA